MPWPSWLTLTSAQPSADDNNTTTNTTSPPRPTSQSTPPPYRPAGSWEKNLNATDWSHYTSWQTITFSLLTTATTLALVRLYKTYLRRIPTVEYLKPGLFRRRSLYGYVTRVGDGDNFHLFHTPGGRWMGWGWVPRRRVQSFGAKEVKGRTVHVRLAGVDAPEMAHFGRPVQPFGPEALAWLRTFLLGRYVRAYPYRRDQYDRVVCRVVRRTWGGLWRQDVGLAMIRAGMATVYEAKVGSEFGEMEEAYREAERRAKERGVGMWKDVGLVGKLLGRERVLESPRQYKTRMAREESQAKG